MIIKSNVYEEVFEILSYMDKQTVMKIPENILNSIKAERNINYKTKIDANDIFNEYNVSKEAIDMLCWFDYNYWMSKEKKEEIYKIKERMIKNIEEEKRKLYNPENIFKKTNTNIETAIIKTSENNNTTKLVKYRKSFFIKFKEFIFKILSINN